MPRQRNKRPTTIYWLVDTRTGLPFYCGKTMLGVEARLCMHKYDALRYPHRPCAARMRECGDHVRVYIVAVIPVGEDWAAAERRSIWVLRTHFSDCVNVASGGQGSPGNVHTAATREKISAAKIGKPKSADHRSKLRAANLGKKLSPETRAKMSASRLGTSLSDDIKAKVSAARTGMKFSPEHCANLSAVRKGVKLSPEHAAAVRLGLIARHARNRQNDEALNVGHVRRRHSAVCDES